MPHNELGDIIRQIEGLGGQYDPNSSLSSNDQLLACKVVSATTAISDCHFQIKEKSKVYENSGVNGDVFDSCKRITCFGSTEDERHIITQLEVCTYRTSPIKVATLLTELFRDWSSEAGWWLYVAQQWPPRSIYRVIRKIIRQQAAGWTTVRSPAKLFSYLIQKRVRRKRRL